MAALRRRKHKKEWIYYVDFMYEGKRRVWSTKTGDKRVARKIQIGRASCRERV